MSLYKSIFYVYLRIPSNLSFKLSFTFICLCQDVVYNDIDTFDERKSFTYDRTNFVGLPEYIEEVHGRGMRLIVIVVCYILIHIFKRKRDLKKG